jgi:hypothetical protein
VSSVSTLRRVKRSIGSAYLGAVSGAVLLMRNACHARTRTNPTTLTRARSAAPEADGVLSRSKPRLETLCQGVDSDLKVLRLHEH